MGERLTKNIQVWGHSTPLWITRQLWLELAQLAEIWCSRTGAKWRRQAVARSLLTLATSGVRIDSLSAAQLRDVLEVEVTRTLLHEALDGAGR